MQVAAKHLSPAKHLGHLGSKARNALSATSILYINEQEGL
jgi:hypothetical protein